MEKLIQLKEFSYLLKVNRNTIVDRWIETQDTQNIFLTHQLILNTEQKKIFYEFFDCIIASM